MLKQRVITSLVLLAFLLPALLYPAPEPFGALTLLLIAAAGWEWARLNGWAGNKAVVAGCILGLVLALSWWWGQDGDMHWLWPLASVLWLLVIPWLLHRGVGGWHGIPCWLRLSAGWFLLGVAWLALMQALAMGVAMLLSVLMLVWAADVAAYFGGKAFGRRKLAPSISPGKTWAGVFSAWVGVLFLCGAWLASAYQGVQLYGVLWGWGQPLWAIAALFLLVAVSVGGDLVESLAKRSAGMKDASGLLPGHGGILDRVDALLPVLPLALWMVTW